MVLASRSGTTRRASESRPPRRTPAPTPTGARAPRRGVALRLVAACLLVAATPSAARAQAATDSVATDSAGAPVVPPIRRTPRTRANWLTDGRPSLALGDILTVRLDERTMAAAMKRQNAQDTRSKDMDLGAALPGSGIGPAASVKTGSRSHSYTTGDAAREMALQGVLTVRIVELDSAGNARIEGSRVLDLDKNKQTMTLTGWIRPQDVSVRNIVDSERIADARIAATVKGPLGKAKSGILGRVLGAFWP